MRRHLFLGLFLGVSTVVWAAPSAPSDEAATCHRAWNTVLDSVPAHPLSADALECLVEAQVRAGTSDRCAAVLAVAEANAAAPVGLYALDAWYDDCGATAGEAAIYPLMQAHADDALGARLLERATRDAGGFERLLKAPDTLRALEGTRLMGAITARVYAIQASTAGGGDEAQAAVAWDRAHPFDFSRWPEQREVKFAALVTLLERSGLPVFQNYFATLARLRGDAATQAEPMIQEALGTASLWQHRQDDAALRDALGKSSSATDRPFLALQLLGIGVEQKNPDYVHMAVSTLDDLAPSKEAPLRALNVLAAARLYLHRGFANYPGGDFGTLMRVEAERMTGRVMDEVRRVVAEHPEKAPLSGLEAWLDASASKFGQEARFLAESECLRVLVEQWPDAADHGRWSTRLGKIETGVWRNASAEAALARARWTHEPDATKRRAGMLEEARALYLAEDIKAARALIQRALLGARELNIRDEAQVLEILCEFRLGDVEEAKVLINDFANRRRDSKWYPMVYLLRAYLMTIWGDFGQAMQTCEKLQGVGLGETEQRKVRELMKDLSVILARPPETPPTPELQALPNVIMISLDTTRPDRLGCYGHTAARTPNIDKLAAMGTVFERAYSTSSWTKPSHASVFTGRYPLAHGAQGYDDMIAPRAPMLAEALKALGYRTMATVSAPPLNSLYGFDRGFDYYDDHTYELDRMCDQFLRGNQGPVKIHSGSTSSLIMLSAMLAYNRMVQPDRPFLYFINYFDAHHNYLPVAPFNAVSRKAYYGNEWGVVDGLVKGAVPVDTTARTIDRDRLLSLYDDEIAAIDKEVGTWIYRAEMQQQMHNTYFVIFADHGEEFMEHGSLTHGHSLYEEVLRVPFILCGPGVPKGLRVDTPVSLVDVMPTLLTLLGQPVPEGLDGENLVPLLQGQPLAPRPLFAALALDAFEGYAVIDGVEKLHADTREKVYKIYDLLKDPTEQQDLAPLRPERLFQLTDLMVRHQDAQRQQALNLDAGAKVTPESLPTLEALTEQFRAMGYLGN